MAANALSPEVRAMMADLERRHPFGGETVGEVEHEKWLRQKREIKEAEERQRQAHDAREQQTDWDRRFDRRWDAKFVATMRDPDNDVAELCYAFCQRTLEQARAETAKAIDEAVAKTGDALRKENAELRSEIAEMKERMRATVGELPIARAWTPSSVTYAGAFVTDGDGSLWQARRDTAVRPSSCDDWVLVARAGRDATSPTPRGEFDPTDAYAVNDIVSRDGSSFIATRDNPGVPGDGGGWQPLALRGEQGAKGAKGARGSRGARGEKAGALWVAAWRLDPAGCYSVVPVMSDGTLGARLSLKPLFEQLVAEKDL